MQLGKWTISIAFLFAIIFYGFQPSSVTFLKDDFFVLAERAFYPSEFTWLKSLASLNQTRITWVGDTLLFRPGLHLWNGLIDILFRDNRDLAGLISLFPIFCASLALFSLQLKWTNPLIALSSAALFAMYKGDTQLATWSHISAYGFAIAFICAAIRSERYAAVLFFASGLFHEITIPALSLYLVIAFAARRNFSTPYFKAAATALIALGALRTLNYAINGLVNPSLESTIPFTLERLGFTLKWAIDFSGRSLAFLVPFGGALIRSSIFTKVPWVITLIAFVGCFAFGRRFQKSKIEDHDRSRFLLLVCFFIALLIGLGAGRIGKSNFVEDYYLQWAAAFLIPIITLWVRPKMWVSFVLLVFVVYQSHYYHGLMQERRSQVWYRQEIVKMAKDYIKSSSNPLGDRCFRNFSYLGNDWIINYQLIKEVDLSLFRHSCGFIGAQSNLIPFDVVLSGNALTVADSAPRPKFFPDPKFVQKQPISTRDYPEKVEPTTYVETKNKFQYQDYYFAPTQLSALHLLSPPHLIEESTNLIKLKVKNMDPDPKLLGFGIQIGFTNSYKTSVQIIFLNNEVKIKQNGIWNHGIISVFPELFELSIHADNNRCTVWMDDKKIVDLVPCSFLRGSLGVFEIENGTRPEIIEEISVGRSEIPNSLGKPLDIRALTYPIPAPGTLLPPTR